jgi:hypothetical protein
VTTPCWRPRSRAAAVSARPSPRPRHADRAEQRSRAVQLEGRSTYKGTIVACHERRRDVGIETGARQCVVIQELEDGGEVGGGGGCDGR